MKKQLDINVISLKDKNADELFPQIKAPNSEITRHDVVRWYLLHL